MRVYSLRGRQIVDSTRHAPPLTALPVPSTLRLLPDEFLRVKRAKIVRYVKSWKQQQ